MEYLILLAAILPPAIAIAMVLDPVSASTVRKAQRTAGIYGIGEQS